MFCWFSSCQKYKFAICWKNLLNRKLSSICFFPINIKSPGCFVCYTWYVWCWRIDKIITIVIMNLGLPSQNCWIIAQRWNILPLVPFLSFQKKSCYEIKEREVRKLGFCWSTQNKAGKKVITAPNSAMICANTIAAAYTTKDAKLPAPLSPKQASNTPPFPLRVSTHGLLAWYLTVAEDEPLLAPWRATWPSESDFLLLPSKWRETWRRPLPSEALSRLLFAALILDIM